MSKFMGGKHFSYGLMLMMCLLFNGCATDTMTKADLVRAFEICGMKEEYSLSSTGTCEVYTNGGVQACNMTGLDPVTKATLLTSGKATRTHLSYGTILPVTTKDGEEASVGIDHNTSLVLYSHGDNDRMYLAGSTWISGDFIVGLKSRILGWGRVIRIAEIDNVELHTEMARKRPKDQSCLQNRK